MYTHQFFKSLKIWGSRCTPDIPKHSGNHLCNDEEVCEAFTEECGSLSEGDLARTIF